MKFDRTVYEKLLKAVGDLINKGADEAIHANQKTPAEPDFVHAIAKQFALLLQPSVSGCFPAYSIKMTSIFCHQSPYVKWPDSKGAEKKCELGDILFIYEENNKGGNALLLQAKKNNGTTCNLEEKSSDQYNLYKNRPAFSFCKTALNNMLGKKCVDLSNFDIQKGMQYLLMFPLYDDENQYRCVLPTITKTDSLFNSEKLSGNIADLFFGIGGKEFDTKQSNDWSEMITVLPKYYLSKDNKSKVKRLYSSEIRIGENIDAIDFPVLFTIDDTVISNKGSYIQNNVAYSVDNSDEELDNSSSNNTGIGKTDAPEVKNGEKKPFYIFYIQASETPVGTGINQDPSSQIKPINPIPGSGW